MIEKSSFWNSIKTIKKPYLLYGSILTGFTLWMLLLDTHSWNIHSELNEEIKSRAGLRYKGQSRASPFRESPE